MGPPRPSLRQRSAQLKRGYKGVATVVNGQGEVDPNPERGSVWKRRAERGG